MARVEVLRKARGWTQERLAVESGVNVRTIQRLEAGNETSLETLRLVADAFGVNISDLFEKIGDEAKAEAIESFDDERLVQMRQRVALSSMYKRLVLGLFIVLMIVSGTFISHQVTVHHSQGENGDSFFSLVLPVFWILIWVIIFPTLKLVRNIFIEPKLDKKYPLTRGIDIKRNRF